MSKADIEQLEVLKVIAEEDRALMKRLRARIAVLKLLMTPRDNNQRFEPESLGSSQPAHQS